jgi:hypothetical protein
MNRKEKTLRLLGVLLLAGSGAFLAACDSLESVDPEVLVVEGFLDAGKPLPELTIRRTGSLDEPYTLDGVGVHDASVVLKLNGDAIVYYSVPGSPGRYAPPAGTVESVPELSTFSLEVHHQDVFVSASGDVPPAISIDSIQINVPDQPVEAVLLDSLRLDSLDTGIYEGFIYPVEVSLYWSQDGAPAGQDSLYWIRAQLKPFLSFPSRVVDYFLRQEQIIREDQLAVDGNGSRRWTGVYAVPVSAATDSLPDHDVKVSLLRSGSDYARFASSRDAPERREPISNLNGAIGIVAGISVDSVRVLVSGNGSVPLRRFW